MHFCSSESRESRIFWISALKTIVLRNKTKLFVDLQLVNSGSASYSAFTFQRCRAPVWPIQACPRPPHDRPVIRVLSIFFLHAARLERVPRADRRAKERICTQCMVAGWGGEGEFCFSLRHCCCHPRSGSDCGRRVAAALSLLSISVSPWPCLRTQLCYDRGEPPSCVRSWGVPQEKESKVKTRIIYWSVVIITWSVVKRRDIFNCVTKIPNRITR